MKRIDFCRLLCGFTLAIATLCFSPTASAETRTWNKAGGGTLSFTDVANWDDGTTSFPNAIDDIASMDTLDISANQSITLNQPITLGELHFGDLGGGSGLSFTQNFNHAATGDAGTLVFQKSPGNGNAKITFGNPNVNLRVSANINVPVTLNSDTELTLSLQSSNSRNLYFNTGALSGSGSLIIDSGTNINRGTVAFFTDTYDLSAYTGTIKYTSNGSNGNFLQLAGNTAGAPRDLRQTTLEMAVASAGGNVCIFDAQPGAILELGALRGDGLIVPFTNKDANFNLLSGTLRTGYLAGTNNYSGVISSTARFPADGDPSVFNYEKVGATSTQIFSGNNTYTGTTTVTEGTLLVNGTHIGGAGYSVSSGAILGGNGSIGSSSVTVDAGGVLAPGASVGSFSVGDAFINGTLAIQYQGALIDQLNVIGNLDISSAIVDFSNLGGTLSSGAHVFATYSSLSGAAFGSVLNLPAGFNIDYNYLSGNQIALVGTSTVHAGDFDGDGDVDGADFAAWQSNFPAPGGASLTQGDADGDGDVDGADFIVWQTNFPFTPSASVASVPELSSVMLLIVGSLLALIAQRRAAKV